MHGAIYLTQNVYTLFSFPISEGGYIYHYEVILITFFFSTLNLNSSMWLFVVLVNLYMEIGTVSEIQVYVNGST